MSKVIELNTKGDHSEMVLVDTTGLVLFRQSDGCVYFNTEQHTVYLKESYEEIKAMVQSNNEKLNIKLYNQNQKLLLRVETYENVIEAAKKARYASYKTIKDCLPLNIALEALEDV